MESTPVNDGHTKQDATSIGHYPKGKWVFDSAVTDVFGDMLRRSIPNYQCMRQVIHEVGRTYVRKGTYIVDLGCSTGDSLAPFVRSFQKENRYIGVDCSESMVAAAREKFAEEIAEGILSIREQDLRREYPSGAASLTLSILSLQFIPVEFRPSVLQSVYDNSLPGGALILVEKVVGETNAVDRVMTLWYESKKIESGYSMDEVLAKKEALQGVLVPLKPSWNEQLLQNAGFKEVDCIWRCMNFAGWVAIK